MQRFLAGWHLTIDKDADLTLSARTMSPNEQAYADSLGVTLIETPIALDAFIMVTHQSNEITGLTTKQIQDIYAGKITNWKEVGGNNSKITPLIRNTDSGSQELMELLVMKDIDMPEWTHEWSSETIQDMMQVFDRLRRDATGICYTIFYYKEQIVRDNVVKTLAVDGIHPTWKSIKNGTYPYIAPVYAIIRSDLDHSSMAYKLYELLQTEDGKRVIEESGYIPYE